jgi:hypothetical protein
MPDPRTASETQPTVPEPQLIPFSQWSGISQEVAALDDAFAEEPEL